MSLRIMQDWHNNALVNQAKTKIGPFTTKDVRGLMEPTLFGKRLQLFT
jgi:hypothetical protein